MPFGNLPAPAGRGGAWTAAGAHELPLDRRAELFRRKAKSTLLLLLFLTIINGMHLFLPPWVLIVGFFSVRDLRRRWRPLRDEGLVFSELLLEGSQVAVAGAAVRPPRRRVLTLEQRVRRFRRRARQFAALAVVGLMALLTGLAANEEGFVVVVAMAFFFSLLPLIGALRNGRHLSRAGMRWRDALREGWEERVAALEPRPREEVLAEEAVASPARRCWAGRTAPCCAARSTTASWSRRRSPSSRRPTAR
jgi:hypothetical protein